MKQSRAMSLVEAIANKPAFDWSGYVAPKPSFTGVKVLDDIDLRELAQYIDWTPFFASWELIGRYPLILEDEIVGEAARDLFRDAQGMLKRIVEEKWFTAKGVVGFWPANSVHDDDIALYADESRQDVVLTWYGLRQQAEKHVIDGVQRPSRCLADFVAPRGVRDDYVGVFAVTAT